MLSVCEKYDLKDIEYFDMGDEFFGVVANGINVSNKSKYLDYVN